MKLSSSIFYLSQSLDAFLNTFQNLRIFYIRCDDIFSLTFHSIKSTSQQLLYLHLWSNPWIFDIFFEYCQISRDRVLFINHRHTIPCSIHWTHLIFIIFYANWKTVKDTVTVKDVHHQNVNSSGFAWVLLYPYHNPSTLY